jgi:hypothetical protein
MNETGRESLQFQLNGALPVGNVIVIEVQTRLLFWAWLSCFGMGNYTF